MAARTGSPSHFTSGRGGAGNMSERRASGTASDLVTPTIKSDTYTTGRGGSGNMTRLESYENARKAQDVDGPIHRDPEDAFHFGRGGAANVAKVSEEQKRQAHEKSLRKSDEIARHANGEKGLAEKIKDAVGLGNKK
ncbi:hypothetical protein E2P81_ATG00048 [Venturia nashicola]|uniref:Uncharacterized protein n=1 Tax=Venturia nashicola TaxID=86259 RepID=A0A4Z1PFC6_9PEZI|nr:hypothetical protein E6O75_ATG00053 [Venturia nashicola]TLD39061.1 hypothetical protein E2P81_ATG00048 [Venturia nashicola]